MVHYSCHTLCARPDRTDRCAFECFDILSLAMNSHRSEGGHLRSHKETERVKKKKEAGSKIRYCGSEKEENKGSGLEHNHTNLTK